MSRGEETDEPTTGDDRAVSGEPVDLSEPESAEEASEPAPRYAVVISGDGSAAIDGEPVPVAEGEAVDAAILDRLQGYARDRNAIVTATISDPAAGYVAFVEVAPDGSSSLLEQEERQDQQDRQEQQERQEHQELPPEPAELAVGAQPFVPVAESGPSGADDDDLDDAADDNEAADEDVDEDGHDADDEERDEGFDVEAYTLEQQRQRRLAGPPPPPPAARPSSKVALGNGSRQSDDEYGSPGLLHKPLVVGPVAVGVAALIIVPLVILGSSAPDDGGRQKQTARSSTETSRTPQAEETAPTASSTASTLPPLPSATTASPSAKPKASKGAKAPKSGGGGGGAGGVTGVTVTVTAKPPQATVTAKPAQDTAATAVNRLHRSDPSGRHICYRAYLSGQGWQKPVCDGTLAGTTSGTHPIKALNIAVYGGSGSAANAVVHDANSTSGQGKWEPQWTAVMGDGKNDYIGSTKSSAPYMTGFAINIGSGQLCRTAKVHGYDWGSSDCTQPRPGFIFGGTMENARWLEAVKLWV